MPDVEEIKQKWFCGVGVQYALMLLGTLVLYTLTCAPTVLWQDSGLFVYRILRNDLQGNLGIALSHPLYIMVGIVAKMIPAGELAWRVNMISAVFGAVAVANLFLLLRLWLGRVWPAIIGAVTLAVSWTFWQHSVIAEDYTFYAAQLFTELLVLYQYVRTKKVGYLYLLGFLNGLSVANHLWGILALACYGIYILFLLAKKQINFKALGLFILLWIVGASPYLYLIIKDIVITGDIAATVSSALFGSGWDSAVLNTGVSSKIIFENIIFIGLNFPTLNFVLLFAGLAVIYKKAPTAAFSNILIGLAVLYFAFAFRYRVPDRHAFFLPFYCIAVIFIAVGIDWLLEKYQDKKLPIVLLLLALLPVGIYFITPAIARKYYPKLAERRQRPYRDEYTYWLQPWKNGYYGAERFATEALQNVEDDAVIYAYTTDVHVMLYVQEVKCVRPNVKVVSTYDSSEGAPEFDAELADKLTDEKLLYVTSNLPGYKPSFLDEGYDFVKQGLLYRVIKKAP
jgi:hypothetical protein